MKGRFSVISMGQGTTVRGELKGDGISLDSVRALTAEAPDADDGRRIL